MRVGITLPHYDFSLPGVRPVRFDAVAAEAKRAEALGFDSVWVSDHFFGSLDRYGGDDTRYGALEPLTTLAALAPLTERVRLGTLVLSAGFRHPAIVAKARMTSASQCSSTSARGHRPGPRGLPQSCFESAMPMVSALRSVWSEPTPSQTPSAPATSTGSTSPEVSPPSTTSRGSWVRFAAATR